MTRRESASGTADPILGRMVLGKYCVEYRLGQGGMGAVYRLRHVELPGTYAALKVISGDAWNIPAVRERFRQEALVAAAIGSHRVVKPLDVGEFDDGIPYIVMEYVAGRSLEDELAERGALPVATAVRVAALIADTMAIAHRQSIVHRDLKPGNVMLVDEGGDLAVKVLDFGVARASGEIKLAHTSEAMIIGTPGYMSPEAASGVSVDGRADVFTLGVLLYEMLSGDLPFRGTTVAQAFLKLLDEHPAPPIERPSELDRVPPEVAQIVLRALEKEIDRRPTMAEMHALLQSALVHLPGAPSRPLIAPPWPASPTVATAEPGARQALPAQPSRRRFALVCVGLTMLSAAAVTMARRMWRDPRPQRAEISPPRVAPIELPPERPAPLVVTAAPIERPPERPAPLVVTPAPPVPVPPPHNLDPPPAPRPRSAVRIVPPSVATLLPRALPPDGPRVFATAADGTAFGLVPGAIEAQAEEWIRRNPGHPLRENPFLIPQPPHRAR